MPKRKLNPMMDGSTSLPPPSGEIIIIVTVTTTAIWEKRERERHDGLFLIWMCKCQNNFILETVTESPSFWENKDFKSSWLDDISIRWLP